MKVDVLKQVFSKENMEFIKITFLEEGYEVRVKLKELAENIDSVARYEQVRNSLKKLDEIDYNGLVIHETTIVKDEYYLILVPVSMYEMTDFIWNYVENFGQGDEVTPELLSEAFTALENTVEGIPNNLESSKREARANYEKFTSMIF